MRQTYPPSCRSYGSISGSWIYVTGVYFSWRPTPIRIHMYLVCVYVYMCICMYIYICIHPSSHPSSYVSVCIHVYTCFNSNLYLCLDLYLYLYFNILKQYLHLPFFLYMYIYTYIYNIHMCYVCTVCKCKRIDMEFYAASTGFDFHQEIQNIYRGKLSYFTDLS